MTLPLYPSPAPNSSSARANIIVFNLCDFSSCSVLLMGGGLHEEGENELLDSAPSIPLLLPTVSPSYKGLNNLFRRGALGSFCFYLKDSILTSPLCSADLKAFLDFVTCNQCLVLTSPPPPTCLQAFRSLSLPFPPNPAKY